MPNSATQVSSKVKSATKPALKKAQRHAQHLGWLAEDHVNKGVKTVRANPRASAALAVGLVAVAGITFWACHRRKK